MNLPDQGATTQRSTGAVRFHLFVAGETPRTRVALDNLRRIADGLLEGRCEVEVTDVVQNPEMAETERILATPTLIKRSPGPSRRVTGDLSDPEKVLRAIGLGDLGRAIASIEKNP